MVNDVDDYSLWDRARTWLCDHALPLWSSAGFDHLSETFHERLTLNGLPVRGVPKRLMVQCRQIYCFSMAEQRNWMRGASDLVERSTRSMIRNYYAPDGEGGWATSVDDSGHVIDAHRDLYAHAFVLLALAAAFRSTLNNEYLVVAEETLAFLDSKMANAAGGYVPVLPYSQGIELLQNPHMHLFEAILELYAVAPRNSYAARLRSIVLLFDEKFVRAETGTLCEYFTADWKPMPTSRGRLFEPGHQYEWIWLLKRYSRLLGVPVSSHIKNLARTAAALGSSTAGFICSEVREDGVLLDPTLRLWPHTEAIKASLALKVTFECSQAYHWLALLYSRFLEPAYPGGWYDRFDVDGRLLSSSMPASSFYHIVCALAEMEAMIDADI